jgi:hypothetical protein
VTIPKDVADRYRIHPGTEIEWVPAGEEIRVIPPGTAHPVRLDVGQRLATFDRATRRRDERGRAALAKPIEEGAGRGWTRDELHERGRTR